MRGVLLGTDLTQIPVQFSLRSANNQVLRFTADAKTWIEKESERISASALRAGDPVEVVCDREASALRYARIVHVVPKQHAPKAAGSFGLYRVPRNPTEFLAPRGNLTFAGLIAGMNGDQLILRTRSDGEKLIYLRNDTRYLDSGFPVEPDMLRTNTRVFVRAGRNLDNELEAYQVIWGEIFRPDRMPN